MVTHSNQVYGREPVIRLVRDHMGRKERNGSLQNQHSPILVVEGFRGAGKTTLLSTLEELLDQRVPHATLDFEANRHATVPQVLSALAFHLMRKCPRYGALQFPRFIIGQHVMGLELNLTNRQDAHSKVAAELERQRGVDTFRNLLAETAGTVLKTMVISVEPPRNVLMILLERLTKLAPRRIVLGSYQDWYGHQDLGLTNDSIDVLVELNRWARNDEDDDNRRRIDKLLLAAFLADLRTEFNRGRRADERSLNCVVLLDNADTMLGRHFLKELVRTRSQRVAGGQDDADPLPVVATSRGALLADIPEAEWSEVTPDNTLGEQRPGSTNQSRPWWRPYQLPDLTEAEVGRAVTVTGLKQVNNERLTRVVFQLTHGHPGSTQLVLDAIARNSNQPMNLIEPEVTLSPKPSDDKPHRLPTMEDQMLDRLLGDVSDATLQDLVTCAAAREQPHALALSNQKDLVVGGHKYSEILDPILWPTDKTAGPALLHRLLQRRLALRDPLATASWADVYERLRDACRTKDEPAELYYALACGDLGFVTGRLHQRIATLADKPWLELLKSVTAAPRQHRQRQALLDEVRTLVRQAELEQPLTSLTRLIAALWIAADPFIDSDRSDLHLQIAADYTEVARLTPDGPSAVLLRESRRHQREADWWH